MGTYYEAYSFYGVEVECPESEDTYSIWIKDIKARCKDNKLKLIITTFDYEYEEHEKIHVIGKSINKKTETSLKKIIKEVNARLSNAKIRGHRKVHSLLDVS